MDVLGAVVNIVLVALTLIVIWYARKAVRESRLATVASRDTMTAVKELLTVARDTATSSEAAANAARQTVDTAQELVAHARETVDVAKAAHEADGRDRPVRQLRDTGELAESTFFKAAAEDGDRPIGGWRCMEQQHIAVALKGIGLELPQCNNLAGSSQAFSVKSYAVNARDEIAAELRKLHADDT